MTKNAAFHKHVFALLLALAKGNERSWRQFALECDISYVQMRKLATEQQNNPPRDRLIQKLAQNAVGGITLADLRFAAGQDMQDKVSESVPLSPKADKERQLFFDRYQSLSKGQRSMVNAFITFLSGGR